MAEAVGVAGSVVGIISLGLDLFKEISQYLDDVDGRDEDLERARNLAKISRTTLRAVDSAVSRTTVTDPDAQDALDDCKTSCTAAVERLFKLVEELKGVKPAGSSGAAKVKELYSKLKYPFKKQDMGKLEECLTNTNIILQNTLNILLLNGNNDARDTMTSMQQTLDNMVGSIENNRILQEKTDKTSNLVAKSVQSYHLEVQQVLARRQELSDSNSWAEHDVVVQRDLSMVSATTSTSGSEQNSVSETTVSSIRTTKYTSVARATILPFCSCRTQRKRRDRGRLGLFVFETETTSTNHHAPECPMSGMVPVTNKHKRVLKFTVPAIQRLWLHPGRASLSFTTSRPGLGLGLNLDWIATVDKKASPAFRMVKKVIWYLDLNRQDMRILLSSCLRRLSWCCSNGKASVTDVNEDGQSILEWVTWQLWWEIIRDPVAAENAARLLQMLVAVDRSIAHGNWPGGVPFLALVVGSGWLAYLSAPDETITALASKCNESVGHHHHAGLLTYSSPIQVKFIRDFPSIADKLGPLSRAILRENQGEAQALLNTLPSCIAEINYCGQSPIHIAIQHGNIVALKAILGCEDAEVLDKVLNTADNDGRYPVDIAADIQFHCELESIELQRYCNGCEMLEMLLQSRTAVLHNSLRLALILQGPKDPRKCKAALKKLIKALAIRRKELKKLALSNLSPAERQDLNLGKAGVLDHNAALVQQLLEARSCSIPPHLRVYNDGESVEDPRSIYRLIWDKDIAKSACESGFDPETRFEDVFSFIGHWISVDSVFSSFKLRSSLSSYVCWMVDHGADLASNIPVFPETESKGNTAAHYFMTFLGVNEGFREFAPLDYPLSQASLDIVLSCNIVDECRCLCSPGGCTPWIKFVEGIRHDYGRNRYSLKDADVERILDVVFQATKRITGDGESFIRPWMYGAILRYWTFTALDLRHTCCSLTYPMRGPLQEDESQEIQEEDSTRLALLEDLAAEIERECGHSTDLADFIRGYWVPKMRAVNQDLDSQILTEEQIREAEETGVIWQSYGPEPPPRSHTTVKITQKGEGIYSLESALRELDEIATDPQRPAET